MSFQSRRLRDRRSFGRFPILGFVACLLVPASTGALAQGAQGGSLDPVVVTANRIPEPLSSVLADVSVVDRATIERSGAVDIGDVLSRLPGVEISRSGGPGQTTGVFIRGGEARHTALYIDGVRVDSQATGGALWEQIPLEQIERVEVLRGPAAAVYGSDAVAGVVQLFTRRGQGAARPTASVSVGSYGTAQLQAGVSGSSQAVDYALSGSVGRSDGFNARTVATANPDADGWRRAAMQGRIGYQIDTVHRVEASMLASNLRAQYDGFVNGVDDIGRHQLRTGSLNWTARWNEASSTRAQLGQTSSTYESQPSFYRTETTLQNYTLQHEQRMGSNVLTGTLERREDRLFNPAAFAGAASLDGRRHQDAVGLGWRTDFGDHGVQVHLRRDHDSEFGGKTTGSLAWGWSFQPRWRVTASVANSFRAPTLYQRFSQYGVASLVPENGRSAELGLRWAAAGSEANLNVWRSKVENLIAFGSPGPCVDSFGCYENVGKAQLDGVTLAGRTKLAGVALRGSLEWHDPRNTETDKILQRRARKRATFGAETSLGGWLLGGEVLAAGQRFEDAANTQRLGGYALVNLFVSKAVMQGVTLIVRIDNLADKRYELASTYATPGRYAQLMLRWSMN